ncbi:MAG: glutaredoxin family protein [Gammaproteobacteria bacterium]|nr:glutaredoxin family protein [Gammaproteobacteria bacterium]
MTNKTHTTLLIFFILLTISGSSFGQIYKWVDEAGETHFSNSPPTRGKAEIVKPKINTYTSRKLPDSDNTKPGNKKSPRKSVIMYSAVWCGICKNAKRYFNQNGIAFKEYDIETSAKGRRDYKKLRGRGVPIILVGKKRINGFTPKSFKALYDG